MNKVYMHSKNNKYSLLKIFYIMFIFFLLMGIYKNGYMLYQGHYIDFIEIFKPLLLTIISLVVSFCFKSFIKDNFEYLLLSNVIISLIVPQSINIIVYGILLVITSLIFKYLKINNIFTFMILLGIYLFFTSGLTFKNVMENTLTLKYGIFDLIFFKGIGGISNTSVFLSMICFVILSFNDNYKRYLPLAAFISYYIILIITSFAFKNLDSSLILNANFIFAMVFIAPISIFCPYTRGAGIICGIICGILAYISSLINLDFGIYLVLLIINIIYKYIDKFIVSKTNKNLVEVL